MFVSGIYIKNDKGAIMNIPEMNTTEWLEVLEPFQQDIVKTLLLTHSEEEAMNIWIEVSGPSNTASFGGNKIKNFLKSFKEEFDKFILEDEKYKDAIKEFKNNINITKFFVVSFLSSVLSASLGVVAGVIAPLIVLSLGTIGRIGLNAYRNTIKNKPDELSDTEDDS